MTVDEQVDMLALRWQTLLAMLPDPAAREPVHHALALACRLGYAHVVTLGHLTEVTLLLPTTKAQAELVAEVEGVLASSRTLIADCEEQVADGRLRT